MNPFSIKNFSWARPLNIYFFLGKASQNLSFPRQGLWSRAFNFFFPRRSLFQTFSFAHETRVAIFLPLNVCWDRSSKSWLWPLTRTSSPLLSCTPTCTISDPFIWITIADHSVAFVALPEMQDAWRRVCVAKIPLDMSLRHRKTKSQSTKKTFLMYMTWWSCNIHTIASSNIRNFPNGSREYEFWQENLWSR